MNHHEQFIEAVQAELDAGRDPLDLPEILGWLDEHPESLEGFANLRAVGLTLAAHPASTAAAAPAAATARRASAAAAMPARRAPAAAQPKPLPTSKSKRKIWVTLGALATAAGLFIFAWAHQEPLDIQDPLARHSTLQQRQAQQRQAQQQPQPSSTSAAVLLSVDVRSQRNFTVSDLAPADPQTGAVVLAMTSSVQHTQL